MDGRKPLVGLEQAPTPPDLAPFVRALLERRDSAPLGVALGLPDPYPLLQLVIGADYEMRAARETGPFAAVPRNALWGPTDLVWQARAGGPVHVYCVVLTYLGAAILAQSSISNLIDRRVDINDLGLSDADMSEQLSLARSAHERTAVVVTWLRRALHGGDIRDRPDLTLADAITQGRARGPVNALAQEVGLSVRTLQRRLTAISGWSPKHMLRVARLQAVLHHIHPAPWEFASADEPLLEFHDQAHFAHDFKQLTSLSPSQYRSAKRANSDCLINTVYPA
jgi:AraC-like DNA-binding protein